MCVTSHQSCASNDRLLCALYSDIFVASAQPSSQLPLFCFVSLKSFCPSTQAEACLAKKNLDKEYADILGLPGFRQATVELILTKSCPFVQKKQVGLNISLSLSLIEDNEP